MREGKKDMRMRDRKGRQLEFFGKEQNLFFTDDRQSEKVTLFRLLSYRSVFWK
jgi:hypothetical protein